MDEIADRSGVTVISRGAFIPPGKILMPGEKRLHLIIEGPSEMQCKYAKMEIQRALEEETLKLGAAAATGSFGRYNVT
jgi:ATP-dependent RNA helicase DDX46/PRP5